MCEPGPPHPHKLDTLGHLDGADFSTFFSLWHLPGQHPKRSEQANSVRFQCRLRIENHALAVPRFGREENIVTLEERPNGFQLTSLGRASMHVLQSVR